MQKRLSKKANDLFDAFFEASTLDKKRKGSVIKVNEVISTLSFFYEKIRTAVDYREEHLLRKSAILRILKRRFVHKNKAKIIADSLVRELIRSRHLKNMSVTEETVEEISAILNKYIFLNNQLAKRQLPGSLKKIEWLLAISACEIDNLLKPKIVETALVNCMYDMLAKKISLEQQGIKEGEKDIQVYIAIHRALIKSDDDILSYHLFRLHFPNWFATPSYQTIEKIANDIDLIKDGIDRQLNHKMANRLYQLVRKYVAPFVILKSFIEQSPENAKELFINPPEPSLEFDPFAPPDILSLEDKLRSVCSEKYAEFKTKLRRKAVRAVIYILLTKILLALVIEVPYELIFLSLINYPAFIVNILVPPFLIFLVALLVRVPGEKNSDKIISGIKEIVYDDVKRKIFVKEKVLLRKRKFIFNFIFSALYLLVFSMTFGFIIWSLHKLDFNVVSGGIFIVLFSIVCFFGVSLRQSVRELILQTEKENIITFIFDIFTLPILRFGRWISNTFSRVNVFIFIMDFLIEAPFQLMIEIIEDWIVYIKEKREEIL
ncbi:MAG: hypothetical protein WC663_05650 [Patescibacteria group bacterium]|jgi:hypothetical protein